MPVPPVAAPAGPVAPRSDAQRSGQLLVLLVATAAIVALAMWHAHASGALVPLLLPHALVIGAVLRARGADRHWRLGAGIAGALVGELTASVAGAAPIPLALACAAAHAVSIGLGVIAFTALGVDDRAHDRQKRQLLAYIVGGGLATAPGALLAGLAIGSAWQVDAWPAVELWWAVDAITIATLVPLALTLSLSRVRRLVERDGGPSFTLALITLVISARLAAAGAPHWLMLVELPLGLAALRFSVLATCLLTVAVEATVLISFDAGSAGFGPERSVAFLYSVSALAVVTLPPLAIAYLFAGMHRKQRRMAESEQRFRSAMHDSPIGMALIGLDERVIDVNPALCRMLDRSRAELFDQRSQLVEPRGLRRLRTRVLRLLHGAVRAGEVEVGLLRRDGRVLPAAIGLSLVRGSDGAPLHFVFQAYDLSQIKAAETVLRDSWWRLERVFEGSDDSYWDLDLATGRIICSDNLLTRLGHPPGREFNLSTLMALTHPDDLPAVRAAFAEHVAGHSPQLQVEQRLRSADGNWRWIFLRGRAYERDADGRALNIAGIQTDTTERRLLNDSLVEHTRALTEARQLAQARSNFLANMSHEIRTPLAAVIGNAQLALRAIPFGVETGVRPYLERIEKSGALLLALVNDVLDLSKIEENRLNIESIEFNLGELIDQVIEIAADRAAARHIGLTLDEDPALPRRLLGDPLRLTQVLLNLVSNAVKFTEQGGVSLRLRRAGPAGGLIVEIEDTGIGIAPEHIARLFSPFEQGDGSLTRRFGGTGLGLAISHRLALLMGGRIEVRSELGAGSCFTLRLPNLPEVAQPAPVAPPPRRVLLAGISRASAEPVARWLTTRGLDAPDAAQVERAMADGAELRPTDLVIAPGHAPRAQLEPLARRCANSGAELALLIAPGATLPADVEFPVPPRPLAAPLRARHVLALLDRPAAAGRAARPAAPALTGLRLLLAEDNALNREMIGEMLTQAGATLTFAENGLEAIACVERAAQPFHAVLMDIQMPLLDGIEAARRIRPLRPELPIIALTAHALSDERRRAHDAGIVAYLTKPIDFALLERAVADFAGIGTPGARPAGLITRPPAYADVPVITSFMPGAVASRLDVDAGLKLVSGMRELYARVLRGFAQAYAGGLPLTADSSADEVARAVHTLKGLSAQIGAHRLHRACLAWEAMWREAARDANALPPNGLLLSELRAVIAEAQAWLSSEAVPS